MSVRKGSLRSMSQPHVCPHCSKSSAITNDVSLLVDELKAKLTEVLPPVNGMLDAASIDELVAAVRRASEALEKISSSIRGNSAVPPPNSKLPPLHGGMLLAANSDAFSNTEAELAGSLNREVISPSDGDKHSSSDALLTDIYARASAAGSCTPSNMALSRRTGSVSVMGAANANFHHVEDKDLADWLNQNFAQEGRKQRVGFDLAADALKALLPEVDVEEPSAAPPQKASSQVGARRVSGKSTAIISFPVPKTRDDSEDVSSVAPHGDPLAATVSSNEAGTPDSDRTSAANSTGSVPPVVTPPVEPPKVKAAKETTFTRSQQRPIPAVNNFAVSATLLKKTSCKMIFDIDSPDFDIFEAYEEHGEDLMVRVAANIFCKYSFMWSLKINIPKFMNYVRAIRDHYRQVNPYHNAIHGTDVLQTAHVYLCVNDMRENFSDLELFSVLFAALVHDVGHVGVGNAFLSKIRHPLSQLFNDASNLESGHAALAFALLDHDDLNFFQGSEEVFSREMYDDFRGLVIDGLMGTDMKVHAEHTRSMQGVLFDGVIEDDDVAKVLKAILHVADLSSPMKPYHIYVQWAERVLAEFWQQGDDERRRGMPISMLCDRNTANVGKSQAGFINFVVKPFIDEVASIMPSVWLERMNENAALMSKLPAEEEEAILERARLRAEPQWIDDSAINPNSIVRVMQRKSSCVADSGYLRPSQFPQISRESVEQLHSNAPRTPPSQSAPDAPPSLTFALPHGSADAESAHHRAHIGRESFSSGEPATLTPCGERSRPCSACLVCSHQYVIAPSPPSRPPPMIETAPDGSSSIVILSPRLGRRCLPKSRALDSIPMPDWMKPFKREGPQFPKEGFGL